MRFVITALLALSASLAMAKGEKQTFVPENNFHLFDDVNRNADIDEATFNAIIDSVVNHYSAVVEGHGANLVLERNWDDATVNAYASQEGSTWKVAMFGGLARREEVTPDGFAMVVCHELGHHLGGFSFYGDSDWASAEGQSDYFATQACAKRIWAADLDANAAARETVHPIAKRECDSVFTAEADQNLCYRSAMAGASLAELLASLGGSGVPKFDTPDTAVVTTTNTRHPAGQCRMDTYFQGSLCTKAFDANVIPGRNHQSGQTSAEAEGVAAEYSCTAGGGFAKGKRPKCWYASQARVVLDVANIVVSEVNGNGNGTWEPGEDFGLNIPVKNFLGRVVEGATLSMSSASSDISFDVTHVNYPAIGNGETASATDSIIARSAAGMACGTEFSLTSEFAFDSYVDGGNHNFMLGEFRAYMEVEEEVGQEIPDNAAGLQSTINVDSAEVVSGINVTLDITHTYIGDLKVTVTAPSGTVYTVRERSGGSADNINETVAVTVNSESVKGDWKIEVTDSAAQDVGTLNLWGLSLMKVECDGPVKLTAK